VATIATSGFVHSGNFLDIFGDNTTRMLGGIVFMLLSGMPLVLIIKMIEHRMWNIFKTEQVAWFLGICVLSVVTIVAVQNDVKTSFSYVVKMSFNVVSSITTTGFALSKEAFAHNGILAVVLCLTVLGGCVGSTAGGIKITRFVILLKSIWHHMNTRASPHSIMAVRLGGFVVQKSSVNEALLLINSYVLTAFVGVVATTLLVNCTIPEATHWVVSLLTTSGLSSPEYMLHKIQNSTSKDIFSAISASLMLIGRVELFTVYGLFSSKLWPR
jgi:trk system potassium uptake protein TrkH